MSIRASNDEKGVIKRYGSLENARFSETSFYTIGDYVLSNYVNTWQAGIIPGARAFHKNQ